LRASLSAETANGNAPRARGEDRKGTFGSRQSLLERLISTKEQAMRRLLLLLAAALPLAGCGSDHRTTVVVPPGSTVVTPDGDTKVVTPR
jgi:hypothetical protein